MLRRSTKIQLIIFVVITLLGISYVGAKYVGLGKYVTGDDGCVVSADFPDSGGIFTNAEVTYRGVTVGKVGQLHLIRNGVRVDLQLDNCNSPHIPANTHAAIADRSVVGEQYVDLVPPGGDGQHYLRAGSRIPMRGNTIPVATEQLLVDLDKFVNSVNLPSLRTTVSELGDAVRGRGQDLGRLLDATNSLLAAATQKDNLDATIRLIDDSSTVLQTQLTQRDPLRSWTHSLRLLSEQLKKSDPDIRHLFATGPQDLQTVRSFVVNNRTDFGVTLANLVTVGDLVVRHLPGVEQVLILYPALAAGGATVVDGQTCGGRPCAALGLILQTTPVPQDCGDPNKGQEGYTGTVRRAPTDTSPQAPNVTVRCTASPNGANAKNVRGSANVPGGDPISLSGGGFAYPRVVTGSVAGSADGDGTKTPVAVGNTLGRATQLGDASWLGLLTDGLH